MTKLEEQCEKQAPARSVAAVNVKVDVNFAK